MSHRIAITLVCLVSLPAAALSQTAAPSSQNPAIWSAICRNIFGTRTDDVRSPLRKSYWSGDRP
jgi:hypothetical protein